MIEGSFSATLRFFLGAPGAGGMLNEEGWPMIESVTGSIKNAERASLRFFLGAPGAGLRLLMLGGPSRCPSAGATVVLLEIGVDVVGLATDLGSERASQPEDDWLYE